MYVTQIVGRFEFNGLVIKVIFRNQVLHLKAEALFPLSNSCAVQAVPRLFCATKLLLIN